MVLMYRGIKNMTAIFNLMFRLLSFLCALLLTGCSHKLFPTAHVYRKTMKSDNILYYFYDYTQAEPYEKLKVNQGLFVERGLKAMTEMDSILKKNIKGTSKNPLFFGEIHSYYEFT